MTEFVYASHVESWMDGKTWRNARLFHAADPSATQVFIVGDHTKIADAYQAKGVPVNLVGQDGKPLLKGQIPAIPNKLRRAAARRKPRSS